MDANLSSEVLELLVRLDGPNGTVWQRELMHFIRMQDCWRDKPKMYREIELEDRIEEVSSVVIPATHESFVAKTKFVIDSKSGARISRLSDLFVHWFLSGNGKIEAPNSEQILYSAKLGLWGERDLATVLGLGGEQQAETTLYEMYMLMGMQENGKSDLLLNDQDENCFYVSDQTGVLRSVRVSRQNDGWSIWSPPATYGHVAPVRGKIFSHSRLLKYLAEKSQK